MIERFMIERFMIERFRIKQAQEKYAFVVDIEIFAFAQDGLTTAPQTYVLAQTEAAKNSYQQYRRVFRVF